MRDDLQRLRDMLEAIERIERHTPASRAALQGDEMLQVWVLHHLQMVGEAARSVSAEFRQEHEGIPWSQIIGMRHVLVHQYFGIDLDLIWGVVEGDLPSLKASLLEALAEESGDTG